MAAGPQTCETATWRRRVPEDALRTSANVRKVIDTLRRVKESASVSGPLGIFLLEFRPKHKHLNAVLENIRTCRPDLPCILFHPEDDDVPESLTPTCWLKDVPALTLHEYSELLEEPEFYDASPFPHILIMQTDSALARYPDVPLEHFLSYDFVGAALPSGRCGNGGFSLRKCEALATYCRAFTWGRSPHPEDWFFASWGNLAKRPGDPRLHAPPREELAAFSCERFSFADDPDCASHTPVGVHKVWLFRPETWRSLVRRDPGFAAAASIALR